MSEPTPAGDLRHALINMLAPLLTEAQLALAAPVPLDPETRRALEEIEKLALGMRALLKQAKAIDPPPSQAT
jgi:hypothetical protein